MFFTLPSNDSELVDQVYEHVNENSESIDISEMLSALPYVASVMNVETNIIIFSLEHLEATKAFIAFLAKHDIHAVPFGASSVRFVTHLDFTEEMLIRLQEVLKKFSSVNHYNL